MPIFGTFINLSKDCYQEREILFSFSTGTNCFSVISRRPVKYLYQTISHLNYRLNSLYRLKGNVRILYYILYFNHYIKPIFYECFIDL